MVGEIPLFVQAWVSVLACLDAAGDYSECSYNEASFYVVVCGNVPFVDAHIVRFDVFTCQIDVSVANEGGNRQYHEVMDWPMASIYECLVGSELAGEIYHATHISGHDEKIICLD